MGDSRELPFSWPSEGMSFPFAGVGTLLKSILFLRKNKVSIELPLKFPIDQFLAVFGILWSRHPAFIFKLLWCINHSLLPSGLTGILRRLSKSLQSQIAKRVKQG